MKDAKREILARVASGSLTAQQAALELEELDASEDSPDPVSAPIPGEIHRVRVVASMGTVTVIGDESVREAVADGAHVATREGDTFVIKSRNGEDEFGFGFNTRVPFGFDIRDQKLVIRMNPRLLLDAEVQAGTLVVQGIRAPIKAEVQAGSCRLADFAFPIDLDVQAGSVKAYGKLTDGRSRIRCQAGSVKLELDPGSSVNINARTSFGRVSLPGVPVVTAIGGSGSQARVGAGVASLDIDAELGSVQVQVGQ